MRCACCRSGLRGAVGLSLSLFVLLDNQISDQRFRTLSLFFMGCIAFLTTIIQGTTMGPFLQVRSPLTAVQACASSFVLSAAATGLVALYGQAAACHDAYLPSTA